jgi:hypothetical protein
MREPRCCSCARPTTGPLVWPEPASPRWWTARPSVPSCGTSYLVTAGHVVLGTQPVYARFRLIGGSIRDERIDNWVHHPPYDIAVAPLQDDAEVDGIAVPVATFTDEAPLGDTVFFIGLLRSLAPMAEAGVPMVRSGTVGRMWQQSIPALELRREADRQEAARRSSECGNLTASESDLELK